MAHRAHKSGALSKPKRIAKHEHHHYWPYLPALAMVVAIFFISVLQPLARFGVLSYATEISSSGLLASTNAQRADYKVKALTLNSKLSAAAQAKANDMVKRNYWAHNTPDGKEPWVFFEAAGYTYFKAGENLAYGFSSSDATVTGWMNSPSHKANLLDSAFTEVGFGYANSENFNKSGPETVVVAEYGKPAVLADSTGSSQTPTTQPTSQPSTAKADTKKLASASTKILIKETDQPITTNNPITETASIPVNRAQTFTDQAWVLFLLGLLTGSALVVLLLKHAAALRHVLRDSEHFVLKHPVLDSVLVSLVLIGTVLLQNSGFIR